jgi:hypothetical protein
VNNLNMLLQSSFFTKPHLTNATLMLFELFMNTLNVGSETTMLRRRKVTQITLKISLHS